ncbi:MAG: N-acetylmuramoyl-L-alanine amidase [Hyphomicrobiales bacterium]|nr:N-acetylmuramoyl-L-alanine amidase [Hyphomicrobiales bacterium]
MTGIAVIALANCVAATQDVAFSRQKKSETAIEVVKDKASLTGSISAEPQQNITGGQRTAIAYGGRLLGDGQSARLMVELDGRVDIQSFYMDNPPRLVIDMSKTAFNFQEPDNLKPRGLVGEVRYGTMARGQSRIVISLVNPVKIIGQQLRQTEQGRYKFTLDFEKTETVEFSNQIAKQGDNIGNANKVAVKGDRLLRAAKREGRMTIVLDPGHGGIDSGAKGRHGSVEKDITLEIAQKLEKAITSAGPFDVYLTRRGDHFLSLKERVKIATRKQADLFISIHADTLRQKQVRGAAVYTLSRKASDEFARKLANSENRADLTAGLANDDVHDKIVDILADLAARETKKFSVQFARQIVDVFRDNIGLIKNPHRNAAFEVLKDPIVPSVLLELGFLSNLEDEKLLESEKWREKLTYHLTEAVGLFFAGRIQ